MSDYEIIPNDNTKEREDRHGRVRASNQRTWTVLYLGEVDGSDFNRKKDAQNYVRLKQLIRTGRSRQ